VPDSTPPQFSGLPPSVDVTTPNAARMYDYMLGGSSNFAIDRETADTMLTQAGNTTAPARLNRSFLRRAVRFMADQGIDQFLDLGSGIPTVGNVHEIAQAANPAARVVYVDNEPVAVAHARQLLADNDGAVIVDADLRDPVAVLGHPETQRMLDFDRPLGVLLVAVFHFIADDDEPADIVASYRAAAAAGGWLALSHFTADSRALGARRGVDVYRRTSTPVVARSRSEVDALLHGMDLVDPGLVWIPRWRPDGGDPPLARDEDSVIYAAVGRIEPAG
jgi:hypothetical protein